MIIWKSLIRVSRPKFYFLSGPFLFIRAAKELLSRIQKKFQKPQEKLKALKEAASGLLSNHSEELQVAEELLRETETKTQEANLREFSVSLRPLFWLSLPPPSCLSHLLFEPVRPKFPTLSVLICVPSAPFLKVPCPVQCLLSSFLLFRGSPR